MSIKHAVRSRLAATRKGTRRTVAVLALASVMVAGAAAPAQASIWQLTDSFEVNPAARWSGWVSDVGGGHLSNNSGWAHSGSRYAFRWVETGYSSVQRDVHLTPAQFHNPTCLAAMYLRAVNNPAIVSLEIINPASWTLISVESVALNPSQGWTQVITPQWAANRTDVIVRVLQQGYGSVSDIRADDLTVQCVY